MSLDDPFRWMLVFLRMSAMLTVFPIFSSITVPLRVRIALGAMAAFLLAPAIPYPTTFPSTISALIGIMVIELFVGLVLGFVSQLVFYAVESAGNVIATEMGLMLGAEFNPINNLQNQVPGMILYLLTFMLFFSLDLHHWVLVGLQRSYRFLPIGTGHISEELTMNIVERTQDLFVIAIQLSAPAIAVTFLMVLIFALLGRAVPQMNVFTESLSYRAFTGLLVLGLTMSLMAEQISNYLRRIPEDILYTAKLLGI